VDKLKIKNLNLIGLILISVTWISSILIVALCNTGLNIEDSTIVNDDFNLRLSNQGEGNVTAISDGWNNSWGWNDGWSEKRIRRTSY